MTRVHRNLLLCSNAIPSNTKLLTRLVWTRATTASLCHHFSTSASVNDNSVSAVMNCAPSAPSTHIGKPNDVIKPRAANPAWFQGNFDLDAFHDGTRRRHGLGSAQKQPRRPELDRVFNHARDSDTLGSHLMAQGETTMPTSTWVRIEGISPVSSLESMVSGIGNALHTEEVRGLVDLDAQWSAGRPIPLLKLPSLNERRDLKAGSEAAGHPARRRGTNDKWVRKALLILSPFGRPTGWYLQFDNRSIVYALLKHSKENGLQCNWKKVKVEEYKIVGDSAVGDGPPVKPVSHGNFLLDESISDHTLRVENCPPSVKHTSLLNFFSRYDLQFGEQAIQRWQGVTSDGKKSPPTTCLVHFADASWARAALREKQATFIRRFGQRIVVDEHNPQPLRLVQYPRQII